MRVGVRHNYRLWLQRLEGRARGEDVGDVAAERLSLGGHIVSLSQRGRRMRERGAD